MGEAACSDRTRRRISDRQRGGVGRSESPEEGRSSARASPGARSNVSDRSRSPSTRRREGTLDKGSRRTSSRRTSAAQSIQEEDEKDEDIYG